MDLTVCCSLEQKEKAHQKMFTEEDMARQEIIDILFLFL